MLNQQKATNLNTRFSGRLVGGRKSKIGKRLRETQTNPQKRCCTGGLSVLRSFVCVVFDFRSDKVSNLYANAREPFGNLVTLCMKYIFTVKRLLFLNIVLF